MVDLAWLDLDGGGTNSHASLRIVLEALREAGADGREELRRLGVSEGELLAGRARVPRGAYCALWHRLQERTGDSDCGLKLASRLPAGAMGVLEYAALNAPNVREGLRSVASFGRLLHDAGTYSLEECTGGAAFRYSTPPTPPASRAQIDWSFGYLLQATRRATGQYVRPRRVRLTYSAPGTDFPRVFFGCPVEYDADQNEMWLGDDALDHALADADPRLAEVLRDAARRLMAELPRRANSLKELERVAELEFEQGRVPRLGQVAKTLGVSTRSLQRALHQEGTQFSTVVSGVRLRLARERLRDLQRPISDIAMQLGYSEPSAFHRAFKRTFGRTPNEFRSDLAQPAPG